MTNGSDFETNKSGTHQILTEQTLEVAALRDALKMGLEIWDEYLSQIGTCVSQDYGRLNDFPIICKNLGVELDAKS